MLMMIILGSISTGLLLWWQIGETGFEKLLILFIFFTSIIPITIKWLLQIARIKPKSHAQNPNGYKSNNNTNTQRKEINYNQFEQKPKLSKVNPSEHYPVLKEMIVNASKQRKLSRQEILKFLSELNFRLGEHAFVYSNFKFENDLHEIYVKIKSSRLIDNDYIYLINVLNEMAGETQQETKDIDIEDIPW